MASEITILHISDFHAKVSEKDKLQTRVNALLDDLARQNVSIDLALFTGDIAYSGKREEYELAHLVLFDPLSRRFQLTPKKLFLIPGNHDVDRTLVNPMEETGLKRPSKLQRLRVRHSRKKDTLHNGWLDITVTLVLSTVVRLSHFRIRPLQSVALRLVSRV